MKRFLIIDDSPEDRSIIRSWLEATDHDFEVSEADSVKLGLELYQNELFDCILLDYNFPQSSAVDFLKAIETGAGEIMKTPVIVVTGQGNDEVAVRCMRAGAVDYINKDRLNDPGHGAEKIINQVLNEHAQVKEIARSRKAEKSAIKSLLDSKALLERKVEELRVSKLSADSANVSKSAFLANMSHEIRSPLTSILGFTQLIREGNLSDQEVKDYIQTIENNGKHLLSVINEILDFSKVEAGKVSLSISEVELQQLLEELVDNFKLPAASKGVHLRLFMHPGFPRIILSDPTRVRQILTNLLSNSLKFTQQGEIVIIARAEEVVGGTNTDRFSVVVSDTGEGINKLDAAKLFKRFSQANDSISPKFGGTGLGLVLSRKLAHLLGGDLELISSEPGVGSLFKLSLPVRSTSCSFAAKAVTTQQGSLMTALTNRRILVVDDSPDNQILLKRMLSKYGAEVICLSDGRAAVDQAPNLNPDVVIMDVQMPYLDGHEAGRSLRRKGFHTPIIGLTAHALPEDRYKSELAGFNAQLTKPIDTKLLIETILRELNQVTESALVLS